MRGPKHVVHLASDGGALCGSRNARLFAAVLTVTCTRCLRVPKPVVHLDRDGRTRCGQPSTLLAADGDEVTCKTCLNLLAGTHHVGVYDWEPKPCGTAAAYRRHLRREGAPVTCEPCLAAERREGEDKRADDDWREAYNERRREQYAAARAAGMIPREAERRKDQRRAA
jgi:hypothetical protein